MTDKLSRILYVEDDLSLGLVTKDSLELHGFQITHCEDGEKAWELVQSEAFHLCVLDVMLPKMDGFSLAEKIREIDQDIPIIFLTAKSLQEDKINGLKLGGDDYLTKPFSIEELILKIEIFLKRNKVDNVSKSQKIHNIGAYVFDFENLILQKEAQERRLTLREAEVLKLFCSHFNVVLRREHILKEIWGKDDYFMGRSLDVFITRLRKYLKEDPNIKIENIPSVGFKMTLKG